MFTFCNGKSFETMEEAYGWASRNRRKHPRLLTVDEAEELAGGEILTGEGAHAFISLFAKVGVGVEIADLGTPAGLAFVSWDQSRKLFGLWLSNCRTADRAAARHLGIDPSPVTTRVLREIYRLRSPYHNLREFKPAVGSEAIATSLNADPARFPPKGKRWYRQTLDGVIRRLAAADWPPLPDRD